MCGFWDFQIVTVRFDGGMTSSASSVYIYIYVYVCVCVFVEASDWGMPDFHTFGFIFLGVEGHGVYVFVCVTASSYAFSIYSAFYLNGVTGCCSSKQAVPYCLDVSYVIKSSFVLFILLNFRHKFSGQKNIVNNRASHYLLPDLPDSTNMM